MKSLTTMTRNWLAAALALALLAGLLGLLPGDSSAANLTSGTYTYVIGGEEVTYAIDPINRKDGLLLPAEVFSAFDIQVDGLMKREFTLTRDGVAVKASLGSPYIDVNGDAQSLTVGPIRLNGRVFLPADLLKQFAVEYVLDGTYVSFRDLAAGNPALTGTGVTEWSALKTNRSFTITVRADTSIYLNAEFILLTPEMIAATSLEVDYSTRVKLQNLQKTNTLLLVDLSNQQYRSGGLQTAGLYLVDHQRRQYEVTQVLDIGEGMLNAKLAPGADRMGVLIYPKVKPSGTITIYYDGQNSSLGTVINP